MLRNKGMTISGVKNLLLSNTNKLVKEAIVKFAISATESKVDAARFLGLDYEGLQRIVREYNLQEYFDEINN